MDFHLAVNLERISPETDMLAVRDHTLDMVKLADQAGFAVAWAAEHHALEMTIAPNPFQLLTWWAEHTTNIRLGSAVANTAYWHPINLAGEAAMVDLISDGRLDLGLGSGAYQREFDRMQPGVAQTDGWRYMQEAIPLVRELWAGDVEHDGEFWQFPTSTSCPKPLQDKVPMWVAARAPVTFDYAVANDCDIMSWPFTQPMSEVEEYRNRLQSSIEAAGGEWNGQWAVMRHSAVYETQADRDAALGAVRHVLGMFGNLMLKKGEVTDGFPEHIPLDQLDGNVRVDPVMLEENLMFGSPDDVINKLKAYEALGIDSFIYYASMGLGMDQQRRSLELFIDRVLPHFS